MSTLYRKYRPKNFKEVVGQNHIKLTLEHEIKTNKLAHAYLFCGPRAVGKTTMARILAKSVNCLKLDSDGFNPCNTCEACEDINLNRSLDIIEIDAASHTGVDNVRENIIANARINPSKLKYKIFIIDEVHMLSTGAFNALLKIMEEPPKHVIFILCTTEIHKIPLTIISRCQRFDFKKISLNDVVKKLTYIVNEEKIEVKEKILEEIARHSNGHMRDAEGILGQVVSLVSEDSKGRLTITEEDTDLVVPRSDLNEIINLINYLSLKNASEAIKLINKLADDGFDLKIFTQNLIEILRKIMIVKINPDLALGLSIELGETFDLKTREISQRINIEQLIDFIEKFTTALKELKESLIVQLPLEIATIKACQISSNKNTPTQINNEKTIKKPIENFDKSSIMDHWNDFLFKIKDYNHSISFVLKVCEPRGIIENKFCLAFKYKLHKERVSDPKVKSIIEKVLTDVYGTNLILEAVLDESLALEESNQVNLDNKPNSENSTPENNENIDNLLKTLGGKIVG